MEKQGVHQQFGSQSTCIAFYQVAINTGGCVIIQARLLLLSPIDLGKISKRLPLVVVVLKRPVALCVAESWPVVCHQWETNYITYKIKMS